MKYEDEIQRRRTFAIISHPDAGKTTLTEKFLLFGGAIQMAGAVKSNKIRKYATSDFMHYFLHNSDITIDLGRNNVEVHGSNAESFKVTLVDTGLDTKTAGRLKRVQKYLENDDFMLTYGDGVSDINLKDLLAFHKAHKKIATVTAVQLDSRFGGMDLATNGEVTSFREKAKDESKWINGGFFVLKSNVFKYLQNDMSNMMWEDEPLERLAEDKELAAYKHNGFWKCMDALRDKLELEALWQSGQAKWKNW